MIILDKSLAELWSLHIVLAPAFIKENNYVFRKNTLKAMVSKCKDEIFMKIHINTP
jgi:1,4-dihydroxy-2-naphthoate octaprenyltransferase